MQQPAHDDLLRIYNHFEDEGVPEELQLMWFQRWTAQAQDHWLSFEEFLAKSEDDFPDSEQPSSELSGENWWFEVGAVDLTKQLITVQRDNLLLAAICATEGGQLRVAAYRPLDTRSIELITGMSQRPHPIQGVCMRENNWQYALDCAAGNGQFYAAEQHYSYISYWEHGLGLTNALEVVPEWHKYRSLKPRASHYLRYAVKAWELGCEIGL